MAEGDVRLVGVEAGVLQRIRVELGVEADAATLLAQVEQEAAVGRDALHGLAQLRTAVAALRPEDVTGQAFAVRAHERGLAAVGRALQGAPPVAEPEQQVLAPIDETVEGDHVRRRRVAVRESHRHAHAGPLGGHRDDG